MTAAAFAGIAEQEEAKRLLAAALEEGPAHAYLFHGPAGVGKRATALAFAGALLRDPARVERRAHPDLYVLEPLGEQIRIDAIRELRHDLHMRPFESDRRVYLVFGADLMNEDAADALLKDLEEPPPYATLVLVADELGPLPETIRSRCQAVPFRRLSRRAVEEVLAAEHPELDSEARAAAARVAGGRLDRARRLLDSEAVARRERLLALARSVYLDERFDAGAAAREVVEFARAASAQARERLEQGERREGTARELEQEAKRVARGAERDELLESVELLAAWYRDLLVARLEADAAVLNADRLDDARADSAPLAVRGVVRAAEAVAETRRRFELNLNPVLAFEALFVQLRAALRS